MMDRELALKALAGDSDSQREIFERTQKTCFHLALRYSNGCRFEAKDLMQKTYCRVFENLDAFGDPYCLNAWVVGILRHEGLNHVRDGKRKREAEQGFGGSDREPPVDPEKRLLTQERKRLVRQAMAMETNHELLAAARLFYEEEMPVAEIAAKLNLTVTAVTTRLGRFRGRMRKRLLKMKLGDGEG